MERAMAGIWMVGLWMAGLSVFDIRYKRVPVWLVLAGGILIAGVDICGCISGRCRLGECAAGTVPGVVLLLLAVGTRKAGWVDGVVLMLLGSVLGLRQSILVTMFSLVLVSVLSAFLLILRRADKATLVPYVPFLTIGFVFCEIM